MDPTAMEKTLARRKKGDQSRIKSKNAKKNNFTKMLKRSSLGTEANNNVTLKMEPS
jgi:hypothetical protein